MYTINTYYCKNYKKLQTFFYISLEFKNKIAIEYCYSYKL